MILHEIKLFTLGFQKKYFFLLNIIRIFIYNVIIMSRGRDWRRYKEKCIVIKRIKKQNTNLYWFKDANKVRIKNPHWFDWIGTEYHYIYKNKGGTNSKSDWASAKWRNTNSDWYGRKDRCRRFHKKITVQLIKEYLYNKTLI